MNSLFDYISTSSFDDMYNAVRATLQGNDQIIFDAMALITRGSQNEFLSATDPAQFDSKHAELRQRVSSFRFVVNGFIAALDMLAEVYNWVVNNGRAVGISPNALLDVMKFPTNRDFEIRLTPDLCWVAVWQVDLKTNRFDESFQVVVYLHNRNWGQIVPAYIVEHIDTAISAYKRGMHTVAVALSSVLVEATLRDVLVAYNYSYQPHGSSVDLFAETNAQIGVDVPNNCYTITFPNPMPRPPADLPATLQGNLPLNIAIRRKLRDSQRADLIIRTDQALLDHWSLNTITQQGQPTVSGLGAALDITRNVVRAVTPQDLTTVFDSVIQVVRNNSIHLSGAALSTHLPEYDSRNADRNFTLDDFLKSPDLVWDLVTHVPQFINSQYIKLRKNGHLI